MPAINFEISDHLYYLNPDHGRWLVSAKASVTKGQPLYEVEYEESKRGEFLSWAKKPRKIKFVFHSPADGSIDLQNLKNFYAHTDHGRDYDATPAVEDAASLRNFDTSFRLTMTQNRAVSPMEFYGDWLSAVMRDADWFTSNMRQQSGHDGYHDKWIELMRRETAYLNRFVCPVLTESDFQRFYYN